jgi:crotonobetainyl-CoA:carnitine CoA-transferase CaiB-like acyl-CoA transferase
MNNLRGDQPAKLGLDYASLKRSNPRVVCAHLSAYGRTGERANWPGYDYLMQAEAGFLSLTGEPDAPPARFGLSMVDYMTGLTTALGLLAAVFGARSSGEGRDVDVSLLDVATHQLSYPATWYLNRGHLTQRLERSAHPATVPCQLVRTADGWVFVMCMLEKFWQHFVKGIGADALLSDERFVDFQARRKHRKELTELLDQAMQARSTKAWMALFGGHIPIAPVLDLAQALTQPDLLMRGMIQELPHPQGALKVLVNPIRLDGERLPSRVCPALGADGASLLAAVGVSACEIAELEDLGVIGRGRL